LDRAGREEMGVTVRPTHGVILVQRVQLMLEEAAAKMEARPRVRAGLAGAGPGGRGQVRRGQTFMAGAGETMPMAVLDTSLCASRGRFKRDTKISLTIKSWQRLIQK